jgi:SAM-dependent methyltransferase
MIEKAWAAIRPLVPVQLYPLLAPIQRYRQRLRLGQIVEDDRRYFAMHDALIVPPAALRAHIGASTIPEFLQGGQRVVADMARALESVGRPLSGCGDLLDFGCGCGRLAIALVDRFPDLHITGSDIDEEAIRWCQEHLLGQYVLNTALPPMPFKDDSFDVIWCGSVFTHLDEDRQDRWLVELCRLLRPGGILLASLHGPALWDSRVPLWSRRTLQRNGFLFVTTGTDASHPDWYQVAWHTEGYVRRHWGGFVEVIRYMAQGVGGYQDLVVARKPATLSN